VERAAPIPPHPGCAGRPSAWMAVPRGKVEPASATSARSFRKNASIASFSARAARRHAGRGGPRPRDRSPLLELLTSDSGRLFRFAIAIQESVDRRRLPLLVVQTGSAERIPGDCRFAGAAACRPRVSEQTSCLQPARELASKPTVGGLRSGGGADVSERDSRRLSHVVHFATLADSARRGRVPADAEVEQPGERAEKPFGADRPANASPVDWIRQLIDALATLNAMVTSGSSG